jgi:hypothetical protein
VPYSSSNKLKGAHLHKRSSGVGPQAPRHRSNHYDTYIPWITCAKLTPFSTGDACTPDRDYVWIRATAAIHLEHVTGPELGVAPATRRRLISYFLQEELDRSETFWDYPPCFVTSPLVVTIWRPLNHRRGHREQDAFLSQGIVLRLAIR